MNTKSTYLIIEACVSLDDTRLYNNDILVFQHPCLCGNDISIVLLTIIPNSDVAILVLLGDSRGCWFFTTCLEVSSRHLTLGMLREAFPNYCITKAPVGFTMTIAVTE